MKKAIIAGLVLSGAVAQTAFADVITWTDWTSATNGAAGTAAGSMGSVGVGYTGDVTFAQLGSGTNYWTEGSPAAYTGNAVVSNAPTPAEMIAMSRAGITNTITFSETVIDPIMAIVSQGQYGLPVTYSFDQSFTVLGEGQGYWGNGWFNQVGNNLQGFELHGVIQFHGAVDSISWTAAPGEYWHGFTVGISGAAQNVPAPLTAFLFGTGLLGLVASRKKA